MRKIIIIVTLIASILLMLASGDTTTAATAKVTSKSAAISPPTPKYDRQAGLYGYVDNHNKWVIEPRFLDAKAFSEGVAAVADGYDRPIWGYIKPDGTFAVKPKYQGAFSFRNGVAVVAEENNYAGTIDKTGKSLLKTKYFIQPAGSSDAYAAVITDVNPSFGGEEHKYGLITNKGALIEPKYGLPYLKGNFIMLYTEAKPHDYDSRTFYVALDSGKVVKLDAEIKSVSEGMGLIEYYVDEMLARKAPTRRYEYITPDGKIIKGYKTEEGRVLPFLNACEFSEGVACVAINFSAMGATMYDRWGYLKKDGTWLVGPGFTGAGSFKDGLAPVRDLSWGYMRKDLSYLIKPKLVEPATRVNKSYMKGLGDQFSQSEYDFVIGEAQSVIDRLITPSMSEYDKVKAIYSYVTKTVRYDIDNYYNDTIPRVSYSAYGALKYQMAVCEGYAELMTIMLNMVGVENRIIGGVINSSGEGHAWNMVRIGGNYYHLDATWDEDETRGRRDFTYFLKSDEYMGKSRTWDYSYYPAASRNY